MAGKIVWDLYMNPNREGNGPWIWGECSADKSVLASVPEDGRSGYSHLVDVCRMYDSNDGEVERMEKVKDKIKKGYLPVGEFTGDDQLILAIASWYQICAERMYRGQKVSAAERTQLLSDLVHTLNVKMSFEFKQINIQGGLIAMSSSFEHITRQYPGRFTNKVFKSIENMTDFVFEDGVTSPIW